MAQKKKKKSPGGKTGAPAFSEPRVQLFSKFGGCNFQLSPREFSYIFDEDNVEQTDLMSNLMVVQNNASITPNQTIQTRQNLVKLFDAPPGLKMTGVATLIGGDFLAAMDNRGVYFENLLNCPSLNGGGVLESIPLNYYCIIVNENHGGMSAPADWTFLGYADDSLVGMTANKELWTGPVGKYTFENARPIPDPDAPISFSNLVARGDLTISAVLTETCTSRITILYTILNKFGPTLPSPPLTFYASKPTTEWSGAAYVTITDQVPSDYDIVAVELYYAEGEYQEPNFLARVEIPADRYFTPDPRTPYKTWTYDWTGYLYDASMWLVANLTLPVENYTAGVPASKMASHDGQLYFWGGEPGHRIWVGGGPGNRFSVSTGTGGGFLDCEPGIGTVVRSVLKYKTTQGAAIVTALCDNVNSNKEYRFNIVENNISLSNEQSARGWQAEKIAGAVGCKSYNGAVVGKDGLYAVSRYGLAVTTMTMEYNSQLQVQHVSDAIEPVFLKQYGNQLSLATLFSINGIVYMTFGSPDGDLDNVIFCYDPDRKAWWTYTLDLDKPILNMVHIDYERTREGIGIITEDAVWLLPTTRDEEITLLPNHEVLIESAELSSMQPLQAMHHLSQLEFRFDYFIGEMDIIVKMVDQFGRVIETKKHVSHATPQYQLSEYLRIDAVVESYKVTLKGRANMRLTHFLARLYPKSNRIGQVWGFDTRQSHTSEGSIHRTFSSYNDLRDAIIP